MGKTILHVSLRIGVIASIIGGVSNIPFNIMPVILGSAADHYDLIPREIGLLGGITLLGWVTGTLICFLVLIKTDWRWLSGAGFLLAAAGVQLSLFSESTSLLYLAWFTLGFGCSLPTCIVFEVLAQTQNQERSFGMLTFFVVAVSAIVLYVIPTYILPYWQYTGLVNSISLLLICALLLVWIFPSNSPPQSEASNDSDDSSNSTAWIALAAFFIFFAGQSGLWAFLERAGREIDLSPKDIGLALSILKMVGGLAGVAAMVIATRFGIRWPYVASLLGIMFGTYLLDSANSLAMYAMGGWIWEFFFALVFCYSTAAISRLDKTDRMVVLIPGAAGLGGAVGPVIAGFLKTGPGFLPIYIFTVICTLVCTCVFLTLLSKKPIKEQVTV